MSKRTFLQNNFIQKERYYVIILALLTAIAGEFKLIPFNEEVIRFGLGSITFFLLILIRRPASLIQAGFITGITVVLFRLLLDIVVNQVDLLISLKSHSAASLYYIVFAIGLTVIDLERLKKIPLLLGIFAAFFETIGNGTEQFVRSIILDIPVIGFREWLIVCGVALLRSYFVVGLYSSITIREQKNRIQEILGVGSELYAETLYLQKSMNHIEQITASSHDLYRKLKEEKMESLSVQALHITQEIHEVKKDSQRIFAGISKITNERMNEVFLLSTLIGFVINANKKYSELLKKEINFHCSNDIDFETNKHIPLLALLNNLIANAVESIENKGEIHIQLYEKFGHTYFSIKDSGKGIPKDDQSIVFEPGYTTKFNDQGVAATGIGLSHVCEIMNTLEGHIHIEALDIGTLFKVSIPTENIKK